MILSINNVTYAYVLALIFGAYAGISETVQSNNSKVCINRIKGNGLGIYSLVTGVCLFGSNITFGFIWDNYGISVAVVYGLILSISAITGMLAFIKNYSNRYEKN
ncbi:MAG: hypothetical protein M3Q77_05935 [Thermoproteota archaeon]|nr:hypothetical protein [Thermoproteota archaeon]